MEELSGIFGAAWLVSSDYHLGASFSTWKPSFEDFEVPNVAPGRPPWSISKWMPLPTAPASMPVTVEPSGLRPWIGTWRCMPSRWTQLVMLRVSAWWHDNDDGIKSCSWWRRSGHLEVVSLVAQSDLASKMGGLSSKTLCDCTWSILKASLSHDAIGAGGTMNRLVIWKTGWSG